LDDWDNFFYNGPLQAALADMIGKSAKTHDIFGINSSNNGGAISSTRGGSALKGSVMKPIIDCQKEKQSMWVDKQTIEAQREKQNN
jgi:hypothetical protein